ncbi:SMI1/KNR4 family protein [Flavobacterium amniphilum]|uniref:SMI1/KNR4 family protein n=1 Tax=Flavobacterium amniphilum TaxID=1834035 RepID=UPI00202A0E13|nr:SMI1/KNR4 family protein [Flavobacterium amniphilum]MCL9806828.1 SMI1/KNR4 family protein [Flavobacterium amniphilum]
MKEDKIKSIIDTNLERWLEMGFNELPIKIEREMSHPDNKSEEEYQTWLPIESKITDIEIEEFETQLGYKLPVDYKIFLKHKHFYELQISEVSFCSHPINIWRAKQTEMIFDGYPTEFLIEKGFIPFAGWSDWGLLCFDANRNKEDHNYPIVLWDYEMAEDVQDEYKDFYDLMTNIDANKNNS